VASRLTIYSPTPVGWGNAEQALKCPEKFRGGALNYSPGKAGGPPRTGQIWVCRKMAYRELVRFGCVEKGRPARHPANWPGSGSRPPRPAERTGGRQRHRNPPAHPLPRPSPSPSTGERPRRRDAGPVRPGRPPPPSKRPALPGPLMGRY
jgi:hypothetical protein